MAIKTVKTTVDSNLRNQIFDYLFNGGETHLEGMFQKINDRQYGILLTDLNGVERYCRVGVIVAEERDDVSARELMQSEIDKYTNAQNKKAAAKKEQAEKAEADRQRRLAKRKEQEEKGD